MTPSGTRGVLNDALSIYCADATFASAFVAWWRVGAREEATAGVFRVREDEPEPRLGATMHRTPLSSLAGPASVGLPSRAAGYSPGMLPSAGRFESIAEQELGRRELARTQCRDQG